VPSSPQYHWTRGRAAALLTLLGVLAAPVPAPATSASERVLEYRVKAVFLERFARFVEWPAGAFGDKSTPFQIVVLGDDPFQGLLETAYATREIQGRPVSIRHVRRVQELGPCHLLFVSASAAGQLDELVHRLQGKPILIVGDTPGYGESGVHVNFFVADGSVRFEINPAALRSAGLSVSYLLLQVARLVGPTEEGR
jgi:hypothetical protein